MHIFCFHVNYYLSLVFDLQLFWTLLSSCLSDFLWSDYLKALKDWGWGQKLTWPLMIGGYERCAPSLCSLFILSHVNEPSYIPSTCPVGAALKSPALSKLCWPLGLPGHLSLWRAVTALWITHQPPVQCGLLAVPGLNFNNMAPIRNTTNGMDRGENCTGVKSDRKVKAHIST